MKQKINSEEYFEFIKPVILRVGEYLEKSRRNIHIIKYKRDDQDYQTDVDLAAEKFYFDAITKKYPKHSIISEENQIENQSDFVWYIDPLDGTREFFHDISLYNTSISLEYKSYIVLSVVYRPTDRELYYSFDNASWYNGQRCTPSKTKKIKESIVYVRLPSLTSSFSPATLKKSFAIYQKTAQIVYRIRGLTDENSLMCWVGAGKCDAFIDLYNPCAHWWDIAPGLFIAENAGAKATNIHGDKITKKDYSEGFVVSNGLIHQDLLHLIQNT